MKNFCSNLAAAALAAAAFTCLASGGYADNLGLSYLAPNYAVRSIELGVPYGGSIAFHPDNSNLLYVSAGNYATHSILEVQLDTGTTRTVSPVIGNIGGLAILSNGDLAITENDDFTSDTILRARDINSDGDWLDAGEITELIAPILTMNFTGAQLAVAPAGVAGIPAGSLLVQTADGGSDAEMLVIENPETAPSYRPNNSAYYSGFTYNGGLGFTSDGHVICGVSEFPTGKITALINTNEDADIDEGEAYDIVTSTSLPNSLSDLTVSSDGLILTTEFSGTVRQFDLPAGLKSLVAGSVFAESNASYLSTARFDRALNFKPGNTGDDATLYVGGYVTFPAATNLLAISPSVRASATGWDLYD